MGLEGFAELLYKFHFNRRRLPPIGLEIMQRITDFFYQLFLSAVRDNKISLSFNQELSRPIYGQVNCQGRSTAPQIEMTFDREKSFDSRIK